MLLVRRMELAALREQIPQALEIVRTYRAHLRDGHATVEELAITKSLSKDPHAYRHQTLSMIAAQELLARGVHCKRGTRFTTSSRMRMRPIRRPCTCGGGARWELELRCLGL